MKLSSIKLNPNNPRLIKDEKFKKLCKSIEEFPQMMELRPIIVDEDGVILGGNMRYQALRHLGYKELEDKWVMRASDLTEEQKKEFIVKDNVGFGEWDWDVLANEWGELPLEDWGLDLPNVVMPDDEEYTNKVESPAYEPRGEKPSVSELCDRQKADELMRDIEKSAVSEEVKEFLRMAALRHTVFDYEKIADFYAHSGSDIQSLMEDSALVIIDFKKAIAHGYVRLTEEIESIFSDDYNDEV